MKTMYSVKSKVINSIKYVSPMMHLPANVLPSRNIIACAVTRSSETMSTNYTIRVHTIVWMKIRRRPYMSEIFGSTKIVDKMPTKK